MVEFVKPRLLGSESEFSNRFIRPIENGSAVDALPRDVKLMKRRSHVLHKLLNSVVQVRRVRGWSWCCYSANSLNEIC